MVVQRDGAKTRFMFMHYGVKFNVVAFQETLGIVCLESSVDRHSRHYTCIKTQARLRASQIHDAVTGYNAEVPPSMVMRLTQDAGQPEIVTASRGALKQYDIYKRIVEDKAAKDRNEASNYWCWQRESLRTDDVSHIMLSKSNDGVCVSCYGLEILN